MGTKSGYVCELKVSVVLFPSYGTIIQLPSQSQFLNTSNKDSTIKFYEAKFT